MMTPTQFKKLKPGTRVQWREGTNSPRAGEVTEVGTVILGTGPAYMRSGRMVNRQKPPTIGRF